MNGGLLKSASQLAIIAATGLFVGGVAMPSAKAADLGGDCCADLEERVAELEATTARKGNRRMSLTVTGQVNRVVMWYDDGGRSDTYFGLDNTNSSSRFSFLGEAKISGAVKTGFEIMIEIEAGGTSSKTSQFDEDGRISSTGGWGIANMSSLNTVNQDAYFGDARRVAWWIEHKDIGRMTVGRYEGAGAIQTIDLGGVSVAGGPSFGLLGGGTFLRSKNTGQIANVTVANLVDPAAAQGRTELVRYDSPTIAGFIFSASIGESSKNPTWGTMLRYAGEFSGIRVAAGIGYETSKDKASPTFFNPLSTGAGAFAGASPDTSAWGAGLSVMHVPSGLFVQGSYIAATYSDNPVILSDGYWGTSSICTGTTGNVGNAACNNTGAKADANQWHIQGGITKNWTGLGNTSLYAEYGRSNDWGAQEGTGRDFANEAVTGAPFVGTIGNTNFTGVANVTDTRINMYGLGLVQNLDAAATELYITWRRFDPKMNGTEYSCTGGAPQSGAGAGTACTANFEGSPSFHNVDIIGGGARIKF
jgi:hypothetical protein